MRLVRRSSLAVGAAWCGCDDAGMRELSELIDVEEPAWPELREIVGAGPVSVEVLPADGGLGKASLLQLQVTARSYLGAVVLHCGGLLVDDGWLRVFGSPVDGAARGAESGAGQSAPWSVRPCVAG